MWFEKSEGRENVKQAVDHFLSELKTEIFFREDPQEMITDHDLDFYNSTVNLLTETINLVINCLLYLSQPKDKTDIEKKYPFGLPGNFDKKLSFAKSRRDVKKISDEIDNAGFSQINFVGQLFRRKTKNLTDSTSLIQSHWRRGHWRNQKFGEKLQVEKLIWIMPTIVKKDSGEPGKGHIYKLAD